jgi:cellobiose-specific phosphotransferase system component IIB
MTKTMSVQEAMEFLNKELPKIKGEHARMKAIAMAAEASGVMSEQDGVLMGPRTELEFRRMLKDLEEANEDGEKAAGSR